MSKNEIVNIKDYYDDRDVYSRSNFMISSKYRSTLFSNRLMAISLSRLASATETEGGGLVVSVKGKEIQDMIGAKGNAFFSQLSETAQGMTGQTIGWSNPETQEFEYISVVTKASYLDGEFKIEFHREIKKFLIGLTQSYTQLYLPLMLKFTSSHSFRLYENLRSKCYYRKGAERGNNLFRIEYDVNELRLNLGVVNAEIESVKRVLNRKKGHPDYAKAVAASPEKLYPKFNDFKRYVIDTAIKEINEQPLSDIYINNFEALRSGRGGKVYGVVFYVEYKGHQSEKKKTEIPADNSDDLIEDIMDLIGQIRIREARAIGEAAKWNMDLIIRNYEYSKTKDVDDIVGFMIKAVKEDWSLQKKNPRKKSKRVAEANGFNNFKGRDYDYDELMQTVLNS